MNRQLAAVPAAARTEIPAIAPQQYIERMLAERLRAKVRGSLLAAIHDHQQAAPEVWMQWVLFGAGPEEVPEGKVSYAGQFFQRSSKKHRETFKFSYQVTQQWIIGLHV